MKAPLALFLAFAAVLSGCAQQPAAAPLFDTYWRPVEIEGVAFVPRPGARELHIVLSSDGNRMRGFTGCNDLTGGFEQDAGGLRFKSLAMTRMACLPEMDLEARFVSALNATVSQHITGTILELRDKQGKVRMQLEARGVK